MNRYPLWKNLLILAVVLLGLLYALPNTFGQDPVVEVTSARATVEVDEVLADRVRLILDEAGAPYKSVRMEEGRVRARFAESAEQLQAKEALEKQLSGDYTLALNLSTPVPQWLKALGAQPMNLGLDLRGGIHVLIDVDMDAAAAQAVDRYSDDIRGFLRDQKLRYTTIRIDGNHINVVFRDAATRDQAADAMGNEFDSLGIDSQDNGGEYIVRATLDDQELQEVKRFALEQNITTLRNRVNQLGVAEPLIQRQGERRIVVQLPGAQDPGRLKEILGATATLEYRLVDTEHSVQDAVDGKVPPGSRLYYDRDGQPVLLKKRVIVTGNQITDASSGLDQRSGQPAVFISLDGQGGKRMRDVTTENVSKPMAVVFIENRTTTSVVNGEPVKRKETVEEVISVANILEPFGRRFQTTGLDSTTEARNLALLLRAGWEKALSTIVDANLTTLIAAVVLFSFGTGPVKGFAVVLFIGILTSMFTAILGTRAVINLIYGGRRLKTLPI